MFTILFSGVNRLGRFPPASCLRPVSVHYQQTDNGSMASVMSLSFRSLLHKLILREVN